MNNTVYDFDCDKKEEPEVMEEIYYAWYSQNQFDTFDHYSNEKINNYKKLPYIYYVDMSNNIIQVTEVSTDNNYPSLFNDVISLGPIKKFHSALTEPIK